MKGTIYFVAIAIIFAFALGDVFAPKPGDEFQSNRLVLTGEAAPIDGEIMDTDKKRSEMNRFLSMGMMNTEMRAKCKDKSPTKKCEKLKKKGKCKDKKTWRKCMFTCEKCPVQCDPVTTCSGHGTCAEDGSCNCYVGYYGDSCEFPEICDCNEQDFAHFDKDADGLISLSEWIEKCALAMNYTMISSIVGREMNETTYSEIFNETDCDDDGNISPEELKMATEQLGDGCCGIPPCCPWCGIVIKTISALKVKCDPVTTCSGHGTCAKDGSCNCYKGYYGDSCEFPTSTCPINNYVFSVNDLNITHNIKSWQDCGLTCANQEPHESCKFWSWTVKPKTCTLKYDNGGLIVANGVVSGDANCFAQGPPPA